MVEFFVSSFTEKTRFFALRVYIKRFFRAKRLNVPLTSMCDKLQIIIKCTTSNRRSCESFSFQLSVFRASLHNTNENNTILIKQPSVPPSFMGREGGGCRYFTPSCLIYLRRLKSPGYRFHSALLPRRGPRPREGAKDNHCRPAAPMATPPRYRHRRTTHTSTSRHYTRRPTPHTLCDTHRAGGWARSTRSTTRHDSLLLAGSVNRLVVCSLRSVWETYTRPDPSRPTVLVHRNKPPLEDKRLSG